MLPNAIHTVHFRVVLSFFSLAALYSKVNAADLASAQEEIVTPVSATVATFQIKSRRDFKKVEKLMNEADAAEVLVEIAPGDYKLRKSFHINRSNVTIRGEKGVTLRLANGAQQPVIAIGSQTSVPLDDERISNVSLSDLVIDGNRERQRSEYHRKLPWIRNNGIDVRVVSGLTVERVTSSNNRSGGLVISWRCRDVLVRDCLFENNHFDGVAYYDSSQVHTVDSVMRGNLGAGVSLDNAFVDSSFIRCQIDSNRDVGVFARHSERLVFFECKVVSSGNWAFFLAHDDAGHGVFDIDVAGCDIRENNGGVRMGSVDETQSSRNSFALNFFADNGVDGREDLSTAGSRVEVLNEAWSPSSDGDEFAPQPKPYSERIYQALLSVDDLSRG